jgi:hypothetical protein
MAAAGSARFPDVQPVESRSDAAQAAVTRISARRQALLVLVGSSAVSLLMAAGVWRLLF